MPQRGRPQPAPPPHSRHPLSDRLGGRAKSAALPSRPGQASRPTPNQQQSLPLRPKPPSTSAPSDGSTNALLARLESAPRRTTASPSKASTTAHPGTPLPSLADRIDGRTRTTSGPDQGAAVTAGPVRQEDSRWSGKGWQPATPVSGKPGSSTAAKQAAAKDQAARAKGNTKQIPTPASSSTLAARLTDRIGSATIDSPGNQFSPASTPGTGLSRSRSQTPVRQPSSRASPVQGMQPSLLARLGSQPGSPAQGSRPVQSRHSSVGSTASRASSDPHTGSPSMTSLASRLQPSNAYGPDRPTRLFPAISTANQGPTPSAVNSQSAFGIVLASAPSNTSAQVPRPAYMEKPAFDPLNRPPPQALPGARPASVQPLRVVEAQDLQTRTSRAPGNLIASSTSADATSCRTSAEPATLANRSPPIAPRAMLRSAHPDDRRAAPDALPPSSHGRAPVSSAGSCREEATHARSAQAQEAPSPEAGTPPLEAPPRVAADRAPRTATGRGGEAGTPPPSTHTGATAGSCPPQSVASAQAHSSGLPPTEAPALCVKCEPKSPDGCFRRINRSRAIGGATSDDIARVVKREDVDAAERLRVDKLEAAQRELVRLQRQAAALEALGRERAVAARARVEAERAAEVEREARRAALLRDEVQRETAERARAAAEQQQHQEEEARAGNPAIAGKINGATEPLFSASVVPPHTQQSLVESASARVAAGACVAADTSVPAAPSSTMDTAESVPSDDETALDAYTARKRNASPPATAPPAKHVRREAAAPGLAGDDSSDEVPSDRTRMPAAVARPDFKTLPVHSTSSLGVSTGLAGLSRTRALAARRTPSGSPFSTREAAARFEPSLAAFLATFDVALVPLAGPLAAAGFTSVADLARFASFESDTRMAVLDVLRAVDGDRVLLDMTAVDRLEDALVAAEWISKHL